MAAISRFSFPFKLSCYPKKIEMVKVIDVLVVLGLLSGTGRPGSPKSLSRRSTARACGMEITTDAWPPASSARVDDFEA